MEAEELLLELKTSGLNADIGEEIEVYKDEEFSEAQMMEHLRKLLQLNRLSEPQTAVLRNLSLLADSGVGKAMFKRWMKLNNLNEVNALIRYGYVYEDTENKKISLHPLIRDVAVLETMLSVKACLAVLDSLHLICLAHGREIRRPETVLFSLMSVNERIINDMPEYYLLFLQDQFPYFEKYGMQEYLPDLTERIGFVMGEFSIDTPRTKALLLDYKAQLFYNRKDYHNALKRRIKALAIMEPCLASDADMLTVNLVSNLYNNIANVYLATCHVDEASSALKKALEIRIPYR